MTHSPEPIPLDVVGCADIFARAHQPGAERVKNRFFLRSLCDPDRDKLRRFAERYGVKEQYADVNELLRTHSDGALLNCTPTAAHAAVAIEALDAGRDVLSEKPMAMTLAEADAMCAAAQRNHKILQLCFMSRFAPCWQKIKELLDAGSIGRVTSVTMTQYWDEGPALYRNWRTDAAISGGGIIADSAAHWIDILRWLLGEIGTVTAAGIPAADSPRPGVEDSAFVLFGFKSGAIGALRNSWRHLRPHNEAETIEIYGTGGTILGNLQTPWTDGGVQSVRLVRPEETREYTFHDPMQRFANQLEAFAELIRGRDEAGSSASDGRRALEIQDAIYRAMREKVWVTI